MSGRGKVLVIPQAFKGSHSLREVGDALLRAVRDAGWLANVLPGSDGGDGLLEALEGRFERRTTHRVRGVDGGRVEVEAGWFSPSEAVVESRLICGLSTVAAGRRDPLDYTTLGVGELITYLGAAGAKRVYLGLGGSATVDGGLGMAREWGFIARDAGGRALKPTGRWLNDLVEVDPGREPGIEIVALADVNNPFTGPDGAIVYAPQKGVLENELPRLAAGFDRLVRVASARGAERNAIQPGAGAAGGLGFGVLTFGAGRLEPGAAWVFDLLGLNAALDDADLVITCEAAFDLTSLSGKLTGTLIQRAAARDVPVVLLTPAASAVPDGVTVCTSPGYWTLDDIYRHASEGLTGR